MNRLSAEDLAFRGAFESGTIAPADFDHRSHVRLAYVHLAESGTGAALVSVRTALQAFLRHHGIDPAKYHETMTRAARARWVEPDLDEIPRHD